MKFVSIVEFDLVEALGRMARPPEAPEIQARGRSRYLKITGYRQ